MKLSGRTILITGGGTGIGLSLAKQLHAKGNVVVICGRRRDVLDAAIEEIGGGHARRCDLTESASIEAMLLELEAEGLDVDLLINNAAIMTTYALDDPENLRWEDIDRDLGANLRGPIELTTRLLPSLMAQERAGVVNVSSPVGLVPLATVPIYSATKAALHSFTRSLRHQLAGKLDVVEVFPPVVDTPMATDVERKKMSSEECSRQAIAGLEDGKDEIWIGEGKALPALNRLMPGLTFGLVNKGV